MGKSRNHRPAPTGDAPAQSSDAPSRAVPAPLIVAVIAVVIGALVYARSGPPGSTPSQSSRAPPLTFFADNVLRGFSASHNASLLWGTYRPGVYFGVRSLTAPTVCGGGFAALQLCLCVPYLPTLSWHTSRCSLTNCPAIVARCPPSSSFCAVSTSPPPLAAPLFSRHRGEASASMLMVLVLSVPLLTGAACTTTPLHPCAFPRCPLAAPLKAPSSLVLHTRTAAASPAP